MNDECHGYGFYNGERSIWQCEDGTQFQSHLEMAGLQPIVCPGCGLTTCEGG